MKIRRASILIMWLMALLVGGCASVTPATVPADANASTIVVPFSIDLLTVDGASPDLPLTRSDSYQYRLPAGKHVLELIYKRTWGAGSGSELVTSDVFAVTVDTQPGQSLEVGYSDDTRGRAANNPAAFKENFALWLTDSASGERIEGSFSRPFRGILDTFGFSFGSRSNEPAPAQTSDPQPVGVAVPVSPEDSGLANTNGSSLEQLKRWWTSASPQERADFLIWSTSQK